MKSIEIFKCHYLSMFAICMIVFVICFGCLKGQVRKRQELKRTWVCDKEADDAMIRKEYETSVLLHQKFLEREPENALSLYHLGYSYGLAGDHLKEVFYYERAVELGLREERFFFNMGMAYGELHQEQKAIKAFKEALKIDPSSTDNHYGLAMAYQMIVEDKLAEKEFLKAIEINPKHIDARLRLSLLYVEWGEFQKAAEELRKILKFDPTNITAIEFLKRIKQE